MLRRRRQGRRSEQKSFNRESFYHYFKKSEKVPLGEPRQMPSSKHMAWVPCSNIYTIDVWINWRVYRKFHRGSTFSLGTTLFHANNCEMVVLNEMDYLIRTRYFLSLACCSNRNHKSQWCHFNCAMDLSLIVTHFYAVRGRVTIARSVTQANSRWISLVPELMLRPQPDRSARIAVSHIGESPINKRR